MDLRVLGPVDLAAEGREIPVRSSLQRALLAMLLVDPNEVVTIDRIVDALWGHEHWSEGPRRLWFHVSKLRGRLDGAATIERLGPGYRLLVEPEAIDAVRFERHAARARAALDVSLEEAARLAGSALDLWRGEPYADVPDEAVGAAERVRLSELRLSTIETWADARLGSGGAVELVAELERLVAEHPYREGLHDRLVRTLSAAGRESDALAALAAARAVLADELGVEPSQVLRGSARRLTAVAAAGAPPPAATTPGTSSRQETPYGANAFVGRERQIGLLMAALRSSVGGPPAVRFVRGAAGAGKSALLRALVERAERQSPRRLAVTTTCHADTGPNDPFGPLRDVARRLAGDEATPRSMTTATGSRRLAERVGALPEAGAVVALLDRTAADGSRAAPADAAPSGVVVDRLRRMIDAVATRGSLLLVVDDLQWADPWTLEVLGRIASQGASGTSIIAAYRRHDDAGGLVARLERQVQAGTSVPAVVDLDDPGAEERQAFVDALLDREENSFDVGFRRSLTELSEGHALFAVELVEELRRRGAIRRRDGRWEHVGGAPHDTWPARVQAVIASRFEGLSQRTTQLLSAASVEGDLFTSSVLAAVVGLDETEVVEDLRDEAVTSRAVVAAVGVDHVAGNRVLRYRFRHNLFRQHVYDTLDPVERALLHGRVAAALRRLTADDDDWALIVARHHEAAGEIRPAVRALLRAAERSLRLGADEQAAAHVMRGLGLLEQLPAGDERRRMEAELRLALGNAQAIAEGFAAPVVEESFAHGAALLWDAPPRERFRALFGLWVSTASRADMAGSAAILAELTDIATATDDEVLRLMATHARWTDRLFAGDLTGCLDAVRDGRSLYHHGRHHALGVRYGNHDPAVCAGSLGAVAAAMRGDTVRAEGLLGDTVALAEVLDHHPSSVQATVIGCWVAHLRGDHERIVAIADRSDSLGRRGRAPLWFGLARAFRGWVQAVHGGDGRGLTSLADEFERQLAIGGLGWAPMHGSLLGDALNAAGRSGEALAVVERTEDQHRSFYGSELTRVRAEAFAQRNRTDRAAELLVRSVREACAADARALALRSAMSLLRLDRRRAAPVARAVLDDLPGGHSSSLATTAERLLASAA